MKFAKMLALAEITIKGHILNWPWRDRKKRRQVRCNLISTLIPNYLKRYLHAAAAVQETLAVKNDENEKVYSIWQQGEEAALPIIKACFKSMRKHLNQELVVINDKTLSEYINLPEIIIEKYKRGYISRAHFADICRVELLYNHGGVWLDATNFVTSPIPQNILDQDFFVYMTGSAGSPYSFIQNCFIRSRKGSYLLGAWRAMIHEYWKNENRIFDYFMHQLMFKTLVENDPRAKKYFAEMLHIDQDPTHTLWWKYRDIPFNQKVFDRVTSDAFFQKTEFKSESAKNPIPGSFADEMINKM
ncbi:MAG: hypothetical protein JW974_02880 [Alphaproteobacteria bacterium]|nr:hypothetical protein [Alphaproteobacteria bacterium]MBN2675597.1 hypothetical protein [Alphaproteobacteria bacterium]